MAVRSDALAFRSGLLELVSGSALTGAALAWFLLLPSLGVVQRYLGTAAAWAYLGTGFALFVSLAVGVSPGKRPTVHDRRWVSPAIAVLFATIVVAFCILYPLSNADHVPWRADTTVTGGSDRDESLQVGVRELLAGRYPYYQSTPLTNPVTQMPGGLLLAVPFALLGNAVWQNLFWFGAFFAFARFLFGRDRPAVAFIILAVVGCPAVMRDFVTGGDLGVNAITIFLGMFLIVAFAPDNTVASWKKIGAAAFTGVALASRMNYLLLLPPLLAAVARRAGRTDALTCALLTGGAFAAVTLPFYWHDPSGFAPFYLHNKFSQFDGEFHNGGILLPGLGLLFSLMVAFHPANQTVRGWLVQSGLVIAFPVVVLMALASVRAHGPNFVFSDYALAATFFGGIGASLSIFRPERIGFPFVD